MTFADENQEVAAGDSVLAVVLKMGGELLNPLADESDLDFGASGIRGVLAELLN